MWTWGDVQSEWTESIREDHPNLHSVIQSANAAGGEDMGAFLCWLSVRVLEMHRILKPTGSLYLHCDHTAGAYIKSMLDAVFGNGKGNNPGFRNEIIWNYGKVANSNAKKFLRAHDTIFFYTKGKNPEFNRLFEENLSSRKRQLVSTGYNTKNMNGEKYLYIYNQEKVDQRIAMGKLDISAFDIVRRVDISVGNAITDVFDIDHLNSQAVERTGYPTQKPLALYERIIKASSKENDIVLDPFAGCATTCIAAERLGREWIGIDINKEAEDVVLERLRKEAQLPSGAGSWDRATRVKTEPPARTDDGEKAAPELVLVSPKPQGPRMSVRELRKRLSVDDGCYCQGCGYVPPNGLSEYLEVDHRQPKSKGGRDDLRNRVLLCPPCNGAKGNKLTLAELRKLRLEQERMINPSWTVEWYEREGRFA